ncbi:MAG TPA: cation transporter [Actinomycetota bacterium]
MSERVTIKIEGMTCGGCENSVKTALERLDGVQVLDVSHAEGAVELLYDPERVDHGALTDAIEEAGYDVAV